MRALTTTIPLAWRVLNEPRLALARLRARLRHHALGTPRRRFLPEYVTSFSDRHGKTRLRFRRKGFDSYYFKSTLGTEEFRVEYHACLNPGFGKTTSTPITRATPGTIDELVERYYVPPTRLGPSTVTQAKVRAMIESFRHGRGARKVSDVRFDHLDAIIAKRHQKSTVTTGSSIRKTGGVHAATGHIDDGDVLFPQPGGVSSQNAGVHIRNTGARKRHNQGDLARGIVLRNGGCAWR